MKYPLIGLFCCLIHSASGQTPERVREAAVREVIREISGGADSFQLWPSLVERVQTLEKRVAFVLRDDMETHRRLDSLIWELALLRMPMNYPDRGYSANLLLAGDSVEFNYGVAGRTLSATYASVYGHFDTILVIRTVSNELRHTRWRKVDDRPYQIKCYAVYDQNGTDDPIYLDHNKKPFPSYMRVWPNN